VTESNPCIFGPLLGPLHDGELPEPRRQEVLDHVRACAACTAELADIRRFSGVLSTASLPMLPPGRMEAIFEESVAIAESDEGMKIGRAAEPSHLRYVRWASGIAAAVFLLAMGQLVYVNTIGKSNPMDPNKVITPSTNPETKAPQQGG
jgi:anti-sigma factor RsiW